MFALNVAAHGCCVTVGHYIVAHVADSITLS